MLHIDEGRLHAYLDGELSERERTAIEEHLSICDDCQAAYEAAAALSQRASALTSELEPGSLNVPSWREIEERAVARRGEVRRRSWIRPSMAWAASIAIAFGLGWFSNSYWLRFPTSFESPSGPAATALPATRGQTAAEAVVDERLSEESGTPHEREAFREVKEAEEQNRKNETGAGRATARQLSQDELQVANEDRIQVPTAALKADRDEAAPVERSRTKAQPADAVAAPREVAAPPEAVLPAEAEAPTEMIIRPAEQPAANRAARPLIAAEGARPDAAVVGALKTEARTFADSETPGTPSSFFAVSSDAATMWLGVELRTLPELTLRNVEVGPGGTIGGGQRGLPVVRLTYEDAAGQIITLTQQRLDRDSDSGEDEPVLEMDPSGPNSYRWADGAYRMSLTGVISSDSLRALAARVR